MAVQSLTKDPTMVATGDTVDDSTPGNSKCIFLDHNSSLRKTKRKRTSQQDQITLEAAYLKNSKPDKGERAAIVSQVDLSEKEVQIWFQNRRQNDRRRSKPLQDHEIERHIAKSSTSPITPTIDDLPRPTPSPITDISLASSDEQSGTLLPIDDTAPIALSEIKSTEPSEKIETAANSVSAVESGDESLDTTSNCRKRDHAEMVAVKNASARESVAVPAIKPKIKEPLKRASSMRLTMTADGAVKIRTANSPTPSPPKPRMTPAIDNVKRAKLTRSVSMFESSESLGHPMSSKGLGQLQPTFGRSRDARTWEFYCDSGSAAVDLSAQAEAQRKGSAVGAINLIRSNSVKARAALSPVPSKGNAKPVKPAKAKIARAQSSLARLQAAPIPVTVIKCGGGNPNRRPRRPSRDQYDSDNDSDKENWIPGTRRRQNPNDHLEPFEHVIGRTPRERDLPEARRASLTPGRISDESVVNRVHTASARAQASELDVVQSLLSLSQGAWR